MAKIFNTFMQVVACCTRVQYAQYVFSLESAFVSSSFGNSRNALFGNWFAVTVVMLPDFSVLAIIGFVQWADFKGLWTREGLSDAFFKVICGVASRRERSGFGGVRAGSGGNRVCGCGYVEQPEGGGFERFVLSERPNRYCGEFRQLRARS
jgi:hypothetical protein